MDLLKAEIEKKRKQLEDANLLVSISNTIHNFIGWLSYIVDRN